MSDDALDRLAGFCGIDDGYRDAWGEWRIVGRETRAAILTALGYDVTTRAAQADSPPRGAPSIRRKRLCVQHYGGFAGSLVSLTP